MTIRSRSGMFRVIVLDFSLTHRLDGKCLKTIPNAHADPVTSLDIGKGTKDSDEAFLVSASYDGKVCLRDANTGTCIKTLDDPGKAV